MRLKLKTFRGIFTASLPRGKSLAPVVKRFKVDARDENDAMDRLKKHIKHYDDLVFKTFIFGERRAKVVPDWLARSLRGAGPVQGG